MSLFSKNNDTTGDNQAAPPQSQPTTSLNGDSTVGQWLDDPAGGAIFRSMLDQSGQNESVLGPVKHLSLNRLVAMSNGQFTQAMIDDMIAKVSSNEVPVPPSAEPTDDTNKPDEAPASTNDTTALPKWQEKITPDRFKDKTIIVTGAGSGIGKATASRVAKEGGRVIAVDISAERLDQLKAELPEANITTVVGDITSDDSINQIIDTAGDNIDSLANIAGIMDNMTPLHEMSDEVWNRVLNVNLLGMMKLSRAVLPKMLDKKAGSIVNIGSEASLKASAAGTAYTTSKNAVVGLSKSMAFMYGPSGIRTNIVAPGAVLTNIEAKYDSKLGADRVNSILATMPEPAEAPQLAAAITFLLSDDSTNINGVILPSDGGWSIQ